MSDSFSDLLAELIEQSETGNPPVLDDVLQKHPQHADDIREFFLNQQWLDTSKPLPAAADWTGCRVGDYLIHDEIARGGMGVVYCAHQAELSRFVALKMIHNGCLADPEQRQRFQIEMEAAAALDHPGIVPIYDIGNHQGQPFYTMPVVEGETLARRIERRLFAPEEAARLICDIADAIQHAHVRGIVHRDLKPENILIDTDGRPFVTDFGLAMLCGARQTASGVQPAAVTRTGQVLGTPYYMSPQQASGVARVDHRTDVYSLTAILYACVCGHAPHAAGHSYSGANHSNGRESDPILSPAEVLRRVLQDEAPPLRVAARGVPFALDRIVSRGLCREEASRYASASELADDLRRFLSGSPVRASEGAIVRRVVDELGRDSHRSQFEPWSKALWQIGVIIFVAHLMIYCFSPAGSVGGATYWVPRLVMLFAILIRVLVGRGYSLMPRSVAERPVWSIWIGYLSALACVNGLVFADVIPLTALFPLTSCLSGFGFIAMAGHVWAGSGLIGLGYMAIAVTSALAPGSASLQFGGMWLLALLILAGHYRRAGIASAANSPTMGIDRAASR